MSSLLSYLPQSEGLLPKWLLFIAIVSLGNSIQCYISLSGSRAVYTGSTSPSIPTPSQRSISSNSNSKPLPSTSSSPVNPLSARTFGTWTALSSIVRLYAAYNIHNPQVYEICLWTYGIAFAHFFSEWLVFGSARWGKGLGSPVVVSTVTTVWMVSQWGFYVR